MGDDLPPLDLFDYLPAVDLNGEQRDRLAACLVQLADEYLRFGVEVALSGRDASDYYGTAGRLLTRAARMATGDLRLKLALV